MLFRPMPGPTTSTPGPLAQLPTQTQSFSEHMWLCLGLLSAHPICLFACMDNGVEVLESRGAGLMLGLCWGIWCQ